MATEHEIDRMVIRLVGDQTQYQKMLKDVDKQTEQSARWAEQQGSKISEAFNKALKGAQGLLSAVGRTVTGAGIGATALGGAVGAPLGKAGADFARQGTDVRDIIRDSEKMTEEAKRLKKQLDSNTVAYKQLSEVIKLTAEQASVFKVMSERTGISISDLSRTVRIGSKEFGTWRKEAEKFGLVLSKEDVKAANDLSESWDRVKQSIGGAWTQVGSAVAKGLKQWNDMIVGVVTWTIKWIKENKALISSIAATAEKLIVVGGVLTAIGTTITAISTLLGPVVATVAAGAVAWLAWDTATGKFLRGGATQMWQEYENSVKSAVNTVMAYGKQIIEYTDKVMTGVTDAIKAGNLELAVKIAWSGATVAWINSLNELDKLTNEKFSAIFKNMAAGNFRDAVEAVWIEIQTIWLKGVSIINEAWIKVGNSFDKVCTDIKQAWNSVMQVIEKGVRDTIMGLSNFLNWLAQNAGKIGAGVAAVAYAGGEGKLKSAAMGAAASAAAVGAGALGTELNRLPINSVRNAGNLNADLEKDRVQRETERADQARRNELDIQNRLLELEKRRAELTAKGAEEAKNRLEIERRSLETSLEKAKAERDAAEAERAKAAETFDRVEAVKRAKEEALRIETDFVWRNRGAVTGMEATRKGTVEERMLIENTMEALEKDKAQKESLEKLERIAAGVEKMADASPIRLEALGIA